MPPIGRGLTLPQGIATTDSPTFANLTLTGNLTVGGTWTTVDLTLSGLTPSLPVFTDAAKKLVSKSVADTRTALGLGTADSPTLTNLTLSGLTASKALVVDASKMLVSLDYTGAASLRKNLSLETDDSPTFENLTVTTTLTLNGLLLTGLTASKVVVTDGSKNLASGSNTDAEIADAVTKKHTQGTDTALGALAALTISRLVVTDGSKNLASNGALTTNKLPKAASSGASLADSQILDDGTYVGVGLTPTARNNTTLQIKDGIGFPATQVVSSDANTLDDYEEGTWEPGISFGGASVDVTYSASNGGYYTKIGNIVSVTGGLVLTSKGSSNGAALLTGLPFVCIDNARGYTSMAAFVFYITFANVMESYINVNAATVVLGEVTEAGLFTTLTDADFANNSQVLINITYRVK